MNEAARETIKQWHRIVATRDMEALADIVHPQAVFRSPVAHTPYPGAFALCLALSTVIEVFEDFTYHREFEDAENGSAVLEFSAKVGDKQVKGVDIIRLDADGKIIDFEVMIRPMSGLQALAAEMGARIGDQMAAMKKG
ncbi:nuclear transport factor 2 family protein [Parvularcula lutaonensis]|uniref:Nuclear transport factor 2 family protein n=1 Tax=Parvularcula lutaonensis TaxID=491923 RepID=A0ABV7M6X4_9PROT|nr:nuclear transport factor 2 family protein [Parvularcula lutaonensis]GGY56968.1 hypothetical protein GCM10007148_28100 [Parvularcula lutaonensis]